VIPSWSQKAQFMLQGHLCHCPVQYAKAKAKAKRCTSPEAGSNKRHSEFLIDQQSNGLRSSNVVILVLIILVCKLFQFFSHWKKIENGNPGVI
jgi:hypothetical protein